MSGTVHKIDFRSDTVTHPTPQMRQAMANAVVGDDVMVDDPTVLELQALGARMFGKEDALFVPSGTMSNLICCMIHADTRGSELIVGDESHIHIYEQGNVSQFGGIHPRAIPTMPDGTIPLDALERAIRPVGDDHLPLTRAICLETTHNRCGGRVLSPQYIQSVVQLAHKHNIKVHIDGARIFNAIRVLGISPAEYTAGVDSLSVCLSKGLAAPVGSLIVGSKDFCRRARRIRKAIGGGMRQVGVLAACGLIALNDMTERLDEDHQNAKALAVGLTKIPGLSIDPSVVETNILYVNVTAANVGAKALVEALKLEGVLLSLTAADRFRIVTHYQINASDVPIALEKIANCMSALMQQ